MPLVSDQLVVVVVLVLSVVMQVCVIRLISIRQQRRVSALDARGELPPKPDAELFKSDYWVWRECYKVRQKKIDSMDPDSEGVVLFFLSAWLGLVIGYFCFLVLGASAWLALVLGIVFGFFVFFASAILVGAWMAS